MSGRYLAGLLYLILLIIKIILPPHLIQYPPALAPANIFLGIEIRQHDTLTVLPLLLGQAEVEGGLGKLIVTSIPAPLGVLGRGEERVVRQERHGTRGTALGREHEPLDHGAPAPPPQLHLGDDGTTAAAAAVALLPPEALDADQDALAPLVQAPPRLRETPVPGAPPRGGLVQAGHAQHGRGQVVQHRERVRLVLAEGPAWGRGQGDVGVVGRHEGDGGVGEEAGEEGGEEPGVGGGEGVEGVDYEEGLL